jgi:predicted O-methyltransferase YrrM
MQVEYPNWFQQFAKSNFEKFLTPLAGQDNLKFLQLGVYTGDASVWLCQNILTGKESTLYDVDTWAGSDEDAHKAMDFDDVYVTYVTKTESFKNCYHLKSESVWFLKSTRPESGYDFIYIDADHTTVGVLMDAELSFPLLKLGGIMAFDDYTWGADMPPELTPTLGIDLFMARHEGEYETLVVNEQYWIKKR